MSVTRTIRLLASFAVAVSGAALLAGCEETGTTSSYKAFSPIPVETEQLMTAKGTTKDAPLLIRAFKKEAELEVWKRKPDGKYVFLKTFPMCRWSGQLGPKVNEGDRQVPEGFYTITPGQMNPNSHYYLSFNVGYPNAYDRANGHTGGSIMVHGICSSAGCFSMTDKQIEEIYALARDSFAGGQRAIQMQSYPFRMTAENLAKLRLDPNMPFWRELKKGADQFELTKTETPVGVCNRHYVFGATAKGEARFDATAKCPPLNEDAETKALIEAKAARDDADVAALVAKGVKPVRIIYADGGQHESFTHVMTDVSRPDALAAGATEIALDEGVKSKSVAVQIAAAKAASKALVARGGMQTVPSQVAVLMPSAAKPASQSTVVPASAPVAVKTAQAEQPAVPSAYAPASGTDQALGFFGKWLKTDDAKPEPAPAAAAQVQPATAQPTGKPASPAGTPQGEPRRKLAVGAAKPQPSSDHGASTQPKAPQQVSQQVTAVAPIPPKPDLFTAMATAFN